MCVYFSCIAFINNIMMKRDRHKKLINIVWIDEWIIVHIDITHLMLKIVSIWLWTSSLLMEKCNLIIYLLWINYSHFLNLIFLTPIFFSFLNLQSLTRESEGGIKKFSVFQDRILQLKENSYKLSIIKMQRLK